jgi:RHS repeat-associated protein
VRREPILVKKGQTRFDGFDDKILALYARGTSAITKDAAGNVIKSVDYTYDVFDRRIAKAVDPDGVGSGTTTVERLVYDSDNIALTFDGTGTQTHRYLYGPGVDQILADENASGEVLWALADNQGTIRDLLDTAGNIQNHITYDSFGQITSQTNPTVDTRYGYTGREFDQETGQYYYRARYYDAGVGRFISEDPIGFTAGDVNLTRYVGNSPINRTDPLGLDSLPLVRGAGSLVGDAGPLAKRAGLPGLIYQLIDEVFLKPGTLTNPLPANTGEDEYLRRLKEQQTTHNPDFDPNRINRPSNVPPLNPPNHTGHPKTSDVETGTRPFPGARPIQKQDAHTPPHSCPVPDDFYRPYFETRNRPPEPLPEAEGRPHTIIEKPGSNGQYTTYNPAGTWKQYRGEGKPHGNIPRPNVKETTINRTPDGREFISKPEVRPVRPDEIPGGI